LRKAKSSDFLNEGHCWLLGCSLVIEKYGMFFGEIYDMVKRDILAFRALLLGNIKYIDRR
jgi:hypothetical protein